MHAVRIGLRNYVLLLLELQTRGIGRGIYEQLKWCIFGVYLIARSARLVHLRQIKKNVSDEATETCHSHR